MKTMRPGELNRVVLHTERRRAASPSPLHGERFNELPRRVMGAPECPPSVLPVWNRQFPRRPHCQLQTGSTFVGVNAVARGQIESHGRHHPSPSFPLHEPERRFVTGLARPHALSRLETGAPPRFNGTNRECSFVDSLPVEGRGRFASGLHVMTAMVQPAARFP